jgi:hypothetical protein
MALKLERKFLLLGKKAKFQNILFELLRKKKQKHFLHYCNVHLQRYDKYQNYALI